MKINLDKKLEVELQHREALHKAILQLPASLRSNQWRMLELEMRFKIIDLKKDLYGTTKSAAA